MEKAISGCDNDHFGASCSSFHLFSGGSSAVLTMVTGKKSRKFPSMLNVFTCSSSKSYSRARIVDSREMCAISSFCKCVR